MAYSQSKKQTEAEKKLQVIRMQLYGKEEKSAQNVVTNTNSGSKSFKFTSSDIKPSGAAVTRREDNYLKKDLLKTVTLATFAIAAQLILKFTVRGS